MTIECELDEYGTYCLTHRCGAFEANCRQENCPHCSFFKSVYNESKSSEVSQVILSQLTGGRFEKDCS